MLRIERIVKRKYYYLLHKINPKKYKEKYPNFLRMLGVNIPKDYRENNHGFIHPTAQFDGNDFSLISIGKNTTISANVVILTHDYSITKALKVVGVEESARFLKPVSIGKNSFIGMNTIILPGKKIGDNVIVGAGSVVTKDIPDNVVAAGNPVRIVSSIFDWANKHIEEQDFYVVKNE